MRTDEPRVTLEWLTQGLRDDPVFPSEALEVLERVDPISTHTNFESGYRDATEIYLRLAPKAQSQCRTTWESLAEIKNPRAVAFVRQANIAHGLQQVNNGTGPEPPARAEIANQSNELLGGDNGQRLDTRAPGTAVGGNPELATVGTFDRAEN